MDYNNGLRPSHHNALYLIQSTQFQPHRRFPPSSVRLGGLATVRRVPHPNRILPPIENTPSIRVPIRRITRVG